MPTGVYPRPSLRKRLVNKILVSESGCLIWTGGKDKHGYGRVWANGKLMLAHRAVYELVVGEIPEGLQIDHLCRTPSCVNHRHLEPVTGKINIARGLSPIARQMEQTHCLKGHPLKEPNLYKSFRHGRRICKECTKETRRKLWFKNAPQCRIPGCTNLARGVTGKCRRCYDSLRTLK